jgi:hypothetical protein
MQIIGCRLRLSFWPQQVNHHVPVQPMSGGEGEQFHQCLALRSRQRSAIGCPATLTEKPPSKTMQVSAGEVVSPIAESSRAATSDERRFGVARRKWFTGFD